jgi:hypothetical protein
MLLDWNCSSLFSAILRPLSYSCALCNCLHPTKPCLGQHHRSGSALRQAPHRVPQERAQEPLGSILPTADYMESLFGVGLAVRLAVHWRGEGPWHSSLSRIPWQWPALCTIATVCRRLETTPTPASLSPSPSARRPRLEWAYFAVLAAPASPCQACVELLIDFSDFFIFHAVDWLAPLVG